MGIVRIIREARGALAILMLAPFLVGGNHCLIGAIQRDAQMRCLQVAPEAAPMPDHACCRSDQPKKHDDGGQASMPSCCILVGPVPADDYVPPPALADLAVVPVESTVQEVPSTDHAWPVAVFEGPPEAPPATSHSSRAPPLS